MGLKIEKYLDLLDKDLNLENFPEDFITEKFRGMCLRDFACKCGCGYFRVSKNLFDALITFSERVHPLKITSASRCKEHNKRVGGAPKSEHLTGEAVDISLKPFDRFKWGHIKKEADSIPLIRNIGFQEYVESGENFIHLGVRNIGNRKRYW